MKVRLHEIMVMVPSEELVFSRIKDRWLQRSETGGHGKREGAWRHVSGDFLMFWLQVSAGTVSTGLSRLNNRAAFYQLQYNYFAHK